MQIIFTVSLPLLFACVSLLSGTFCRGEEGSGHRHFNLSEEFKNVTIWPSGKDLPCNLGSKVPPGTCKKVNGQLYCLPSFMIIGAMKAGTSEMRDRLRESPLIISGNKGQEVHFFDNYFGFSTNSLADRYPFARPKGMNCPSEVYLKFFPVSKPIMTFEKTPSYMRSLLIMGKINSWFPLMKFIVLLRNPTDRLYSSFCHHIRHNRVRYYSDEEWYKYHGSPPPNGPGVGKFDAKNEKKSTLSIAPS